MFFINQIKCSRDLDHYIQEQNNNKFDGALLSLAPNTSPQYLASLSESLPSVLINIVDEYYSLEGKEVTNLVITVLQDAYKNSGVLTSEEQMKLLQEKSSLIREINFSLIEITICAFGTSFHANTMYRHFFGCIKRYFPQCKYLIIPPSIKCSHQTRKNCFAINKVNWSQSMAAEYSSMQVSVQKGAVKSSLIPAVFNLSSFFTAIDRNPQT